MRPDNASRTPGIRARVRGIVRSFRNRLAHAQRRPRHGDVPQSEATYRQRVAAEHGHFDSCEEVHALPPIFHYWSNRYLRPRLEAFGVSHPDAFFAKYLVECYGRGSGTRRFLSLGAGNCDTEVRLARALRDAGCHRFAIECLELNKAMLVRGQQLAARERVADNIVPLEADLNHWRPMTQYDGVIASQSLHHVMALERVFDSVSTSLAPHARFIVSDMIGRNGHQRWPEALAIVREFWRELPSTYRYNRQLKRQEHEFLDWDCSTEGFEGIRAQDILPLLVERFGFDVFIGFANVIAPFVDRSFGPNFSNDAQWDREFIDRVHARDESEMAAGRIKPTQMFAVMGVGASDAAPAAATSAARAAIRMP
jgi:SAM-dependent methyltransferase